jgi:hypothetical protein
MKELLSFLIENKEWLFSGIGIALVGLAIEISSSISIKIEEFDSKFYSYLYWIKTNSQWLFSGIGVILVSVIISIAFNADIEKNNKTGGQEKSYARQIQELEDIETSISDLNNFIELQKRKLQESENILQSLKKEHDTLKPIVDTEREVIEKIFIVQSQKAMDRIWKERVVSFFLGILASLFASFIYGLFQRFYKNNKKS